MLLIIVMHLYMSIYYCRSGEVSSHPAEDGRRPETYSINRYTMDETQSDNELREFPQHRR